MRSDFIYIIVIHLVQLKLVKLKLVKLKIEKEVIVYDSNSISTIKKFDT